MKSMAASVAHDDWVSWHEIYLRTQDLTLGPYAPIRYDPPPLTSYTGGVKVVVAPWQFDIYIPPSLHFYNELIDRVYRKVRMLVKVFQRPGTLRKQRTFEHPLDLNDWKICAVYINKSASTQLNKKRAVKYSRDWNCGVRFSSLPRRTRQLIEDAVDKLHVVEALLLSTDVTKHQPLISEINSISAVPFIRIQAYSNGGIINTVYTSSKGITKKKILALKKQQETDMNRGAYETSLITEFSTFLEHYYESRCPFPTGIKDAEEWRPRNAPGQSIGVRKSTRALMMLAKIKGGITKTTAIRIKGSKVKRKTSKTTKKSKGVGKSGSTTTTTTSEAAKKRTTKGKTTKKKTKSSEAAKKRNVAALIEQTTKQRALLRSKKCKLPGIGAAHYREFTNRKELAAGLKDRSLHYHYYEADPEERTRLELIAAPMKRPNVMKVFNAIKAITNLSRPILVILCGIHGMSAPVQADIWENSIEVVPKRKRNNRLAAFKEQYMNVDIYQRIYMLDFLKLFHFAMSKSVRAWLVEDSLMDELNELGYDV